MSQKSSPKPKLVFAISNLHAGGAERVMSLLVSHFAASKDYETHLFLLNSDKEPLFYPLHKNVLVHQLNVLKRPDKGIPKLRKILKEVAPDVVISFLRDVNVRVLAASLGLPHKAIISERNHPTLHKTSAITQAIRYPLYKMKADQIVLQTERVLDYYPDFVAAKTTVIANPTEQHAKPVKAAAKTIVAAGRLVEVKNHAALIDAFTDIEDTYPGWQLKIFGEGPLYPDLKKQIHLRGLEDKVRLMGKSTSPGGWVNEGEIFVLPSRYEGFPNVLIEAMAAGLSCIAMDCPCGPREAIEDEHSGLLVPDASYLPLALSRVMGDNTMRKKLGQNAFAKAKDYAPEVIFDQWEALVQETLQTKAEKTEKIEKAR